MDKRYLNYLNFINSVKRKEKSIIFAIDYVVLSKEGYEALIDFHHPEIKSISYDEFEMHDWIKQRFLRQDEKK